MAGKYTSPPNQIKLNLDYRTMDKLKAVAAARKVDPTRCAYELLQEALGLIELPAITPASPGDAIPSRVVDWASLPAFSKSKPEGNA